MAKFRIPGPAAAKPTSPVLLFRDLKRDPSIKYLWGHQEKLLDGYMASHYQSSNVAVELPTGAGKTLVGLLLAEYRRRAEGERAVFCCPTRQLAAQVDGQAAKYGIGTVLLVGEQKSYDQAAFLSYQQARAIAVTTYSGIFNAKPRLNDAQVLICDDAHAAEQFVASRWTVSVSRHEKREKDLFHLLRRVLEPALTNEMAHAIDYYDRMPHKGMNIDVLSEIVMHDCRSTLVEALDGADMPADVKFPWLAIREHLDACNIYVSPDAFEIRPIIPPTLSHDAFASAKQRVYMSATLGEDGDIERMFGIHKMTRLPIPDGWDKRGTGRRLILFPGLSSGEQAAGKTVTEAMNLVPRTLVLVPDDRRREVSQKAMIDAGFAVLSARDIEADLTSFTGHAGKAVLLIANRYDGIDLPGDDCRMMVLLGLPVGAGLQERYLLHRLGAVAQLRDRIRTRVTQALGRCTRDESDYACVFVLGEDLSKWFCTTANVEGMHPELQAEIHFGKENSTDRTPTEILDMAKAFLGRSSEWDDAEQAIQTDRGQRNRASDSVAATLAKSTSAEIDYVYRLWNGDYEGALNKAVEAIGLLEGGKELRPYRSFWYHEGAEAAFLGWKASGSAPLKTKAAELIGDAGNTSLGLKWLSRARTVLTGTNAAEELLPLQAWFAELDKLLADWGITGSRFAKRLAEAQAELDGTEAKAFERGLKTLGRMLGASAHSWSKKDDGTPDGLWVYADWHAFLFEAKTEEEGSTVPLKDVRQALTHRERAIADLLLHQDVPSSTSIVSAQTHVDTEAKKVAGELRHVHPDVLRDLFRRASRALEAVRAMATKTSPEALIDEAVRLYEVNGASMRDVKKVLVVQRIDEMATR